MFQDYLWIIIPSIIILYILLIVYRSKKTHRMFRHLIRRELNLVENTPSRLASMEEIKSLPPVIQKYLLMTGVVGKPVVRSLQILSNIEINLGNDQGWTTMKSLEYNFFHNRPTRAVFMRFRAKGLPVIGMDSYLQGKGRMLVQPFGLFSVTDAKGTFMDNTSAAVMMLLNMVASAPSLLIDSRISFEPVDESTVNVIYQDEEIRVSGILRFRENGELASFYTEDKYYLNEKGEYIKSGWSTTFHRYETIQGLHLSTYGEAVWHFAEGDYCYGKLTLIDLIYH